MANYMIRGLEKPPSGYIDIRIFEDGRMAIPSHKPPYFEELRLTPGVAYGVYLYDFELPKNGYIDIRVHPDRKIITPILDPPYYREISALFIERVEERR